MTEKYHVNWGEVEEWVGMIYGKLPFKPSVIVAISRGGLIPGVMLSHMTGCRKLYSAYAMQYADDNNTRGEFQIDVDLQAHLAMLRADTVVIDDIVDTGKTFKFLQEHGYINPYYCSLATKGVEHLNWPHAVLFRTDQWVVFPWEIEPTSYLQEMHDAKQS